MDLECGGTFSVSQGNISSPNYPKNYEPNTYCQWLLRTEPSHSILFRFTDFDLEDDCTADSVQVYDGSEKNPDKLLLRSCGSQITTPDATNQTNRPGFTTPLRSRDNQMLIVMEADHGVQAKGFAAQYETVALIHMLFVHNETLNSNQLLFYHFRHVDRKLLRQRLAIWKLDTIYVGSLIIVNGSSQPVIQVRN